MKKKIAAVVLVTIICASVYWWYSKNASVQPSGLQATGTIEATQVELRAKLPGTLEQINVQAGQLVKKDQLIGVIVRNDLNAQKERDALGVLKAQAQLDDLLSGAREQEIKEAQLAVNSASINLDKANTDFTRAQALYQEGVIPAAEMERYETTMLQFQNQLELSKTKLNLLQNGSRPKQIEAARTELERSNAVLKASAALLEDTKIFSPLDGIVLTKNFQQGEYIPAGSPVATIANLNDMWIKVYIPTDDLPKIKLGHQVQFTVSGSDQQYQGTVEEIASRGEFTPKTIQTKNERTNIVFAVKIRINNEEGVLKPGMPADVSID